MAVISGYAGPAIDCPDVPALVDFYVRLTGWRKAWESEEFTQISPDGTAYNGLGFQQVENYRAPEWPGQERPQQFHLDFFAADLDTAQQEAVELGAVLAEVQPDPERWRVLLDPAGHPFCLCVEPDR
jgi:catechol 2,3-dioxygenase-like lactoylglutathione lyase family enzyme